MFREPAPGTRFGRWFVRRKLGQGGMGVVYLVDDGQGREAALKLLLVHDATLLTRFEREARATATLRHDNIAQTYEFLTEHGVPAFTMELLTGGTLSELVKKRGALPWPEAATFAAGIARGLAAVHVRGLVHRDLKPANILLDGTGRPKITDFGLIRRADALSQGGRQALTKTGDVLGSYAYMAPEQAEDAKVDYRADLYSLGALLYELLAGRPPFEGEGYAVIKKHLTDAPRSLRSLGIPERLDRLVLQLLAKDPAARPETAADVARDLEEILRAKEEPAPRARRTGVLVALGIVAAAIGGAGLTVALRGAGSALPPVPAPPGPPPTPRTPPPPPPPPAPTWAPAEQRFQDRCAKAFPKGPHTKLVSARGRDAMGHAGTARIVVFARVGASKKLVLLSAGYADGVLHGWDPETGEEAMAAITFEAGLRSLAVDPGSRRLVVGTGTGSAYVYDLATWKRISERVTGWSELAVAISSDGAFAAGASGVGTEGRILWWSIDRKADDVTLELNAPPWWLRFAPGESRKIAYGWDNGPVHLRDLDEAGPLPLEAHGDRACTEGVFDRDGRILSIGDDHTLRRQKPPAPPEIRSVHEQSTTRLYGLALSLDERTIATSGTDGFVELREAATLALKKRIPASKIAVDSVAFHPDGKRLALACDDGSVTMLDLETGKDLLAPVDLETHTAPVRALAISPDGRALVTGSIDKALKVWEVVDQSVTLRRTEELKAASGGLAFVPGGDPASPRLLAVGADGSLEVRKLAPASTERKAHFDAYPGGSLLALSSDGAYVAVDGGWGCDGRVFRFADLEKDVGIRLPTTGEQSAIYAADFSKDGRLVVLASPSPAGKNLFVAKLADRKLLGPLDVDTKGYVAAVAFLDPEGKRVVAGGPSGTISVWDLATRQKLRERKSETGVAQLLLLDGRIVARAGPKVLVLDEALEVLDTIDVGKLHDLATAAGVDPARHELWLGTGRGAILRFRVE